MEIKVEEEKKEKAKYNPLQNTAFMLKTAWETRKSVPFMCIAIAALSVITSLLWLLISPVILQKVEMSVPLSELIITITVFTVLLVLTNSLSIYVSGLTMFPRIDVRVSIMRLYARKTASTSLPNREDAEFNKKLSRAMYSTGSNDRAVEGIWNTYSDIIKNIAGFIIYLLMLSGLDFYLMLVVIVTTVAGFFVNNRINGYGYRHRDEENIYRNKLWYLTGLSQNTQYAKDIRIFGMKQWLGDIYEKTVDLYTAFLVRAEKVYLWSNVIDIALTFLRNGIAYFYLIKMALDGNLAASEFLFYFTAFTGFTDWVSGILKGFSTLNEQSRDLSTIREVLDTPEPFLFESGSDVPKADGYELTLKNVTFRYPEAENDTLHNVNLTIHAGEKLAVVGLNGAGKTTLVKLLCGFYDPTEGEVLLNGMDIRKFDRRKYYDIFSAVFQDFSVMDVTIAENVSQHILEEADMPRVRDCIAKAGLTDKINNLPKGYDTIIGREVYLDGIELSGGEKQRMLLARALYKEAPIIVLDEPTAALDPIAENDLYLKYNEMTKGKTSVYISHRLASTRFCDRIILIADGGIAEEGTHDQLIAQKGRYAELFEVQSRYYREGGDFNEAQD